MQKVAVLRRLCGEELDVLRGRTDDTDVTALLAFFNGETATEYLDLSEELHGEGYICTNLNPNFGEFPFHALR
jgi:hypothetical protein